MYKFKMDKLFRDKILEDMQNHQVDFDLEILNDDKYIFALKEKLVEEAHEVQTSTNDKELIEELADVMEVIQSLLAVKKITMNDVLKCAKDKKNKKGGFEGRNKVYTLKLNENDNKHTAWIKYFIDKPEKYPKIDF